MINKNYIIRKIGMLKNGGRVIPDRQLMHPEREWGIGLILFPFLILTGGAYAFFAFNSYSGISIGDEVVEADQLHYKRADALKAIELYQNKKNTFDTEITKIPNNEENFGAELEVETGNGIESESGGVLENEAVEQTEDSENIEFIQLETQMDQPIFLE